MPEKPVSWPKRQILFMLIKDGYRPSVWPSETQLASHWDKKERDSNGTVKRPAREN